MSATLPQLSSIMQEGEYLLVPCVANILVMFGDRVRQVPVSVTDRVCLGQILPVSRLRQQSKDARVLVEKVPESRLALDLGEGKVLPVIRDRVTQFSYHLRLPRCTPPNAPSSVAITRPL